MNQMFTAPPQTHLLLRKAEVYSLSIRFAKRWS